MADSEQLAVVILAAGEGTRMRSKRPKVLHELCGRAVLEHAVHAAAGLEPTRTVCVVGSGEAQVRERLADAPVEFAAQTERLGTGHAVLQTRDLLAGHDGPVLVFYADHPLFRSETLSGLIDAWRESSDGVAVLVGEYPEQSDMGRIVRGPDGRLERIVEFHDATPEVRALREVNLGVYALDRALLFALLDRVDNQNAKGEYYLTDIVPLALAEGREVVTATLGDWDEAMGINSRADLADAERVVRRRIARHWMREGVTLEDPDHAYIGTDVTIGADTTLGPGAALRGRTVVGAGCRIDSGVVVADSRIGDGVWLKPNCTIDQSELADGCIAGPSANLRPGTRLAESVRIGNFVEVKNSIIGRGTKADHLSYIGDADVGEDVTFACGAITVNYDGRKKTRTTVGDGVFVGCNANLIAPVTIEPRSYVAAGSTITQTVPGGALAVARGRQRNVEGWMERKFGNREDGE